MEEKDPTKQILFYVASIYLLLRNVAWIVGILVSLIFIIYKLLAGICEASLWPTPSPVPTEIHFPTATEMYEEHCRRENAKDELQKALEEGRREQAAKEVEYQKQLKEKTEKEAEQKKRDIEKAERDYQEWIKGREEEKQLRREMAEIEKKYGRSSHMNVQNL